MSGSGRKALYLCTHSITSILRITPYFSVHSMSQCLHTCICVVLIAQPLFPVPVSRQEYAVGPDRGNRAKGNSVNNTIHTLRDQPVVRSLGLICPVAAQATLI